MRSWVMLAAVGPVLAACGGSGENADADAAAAGYTPPSVTSRLDYGGMIERRFHRLDLDRDDKLQPEELPERWRGIITRNDKDGDGALSSEEWGTMLLDRFDAQDLNKDGTVTSEERATWRAQQAARRNGG